MLGPTGSQCVAASAETRIASTWPAHGPSGAPQPRTKVSGPASSRMAATRRSSAAARERAVVAAVGGHRGAVEEVALEVAEAPLVDERAHDAAHVRERLRVRDVEREHPQPGRRVPAVDGAAARVAQDPLGVRRRERRVLGERRRREPQPGDEARRARGGGERAQPVGELGVRREPVAPRRLPAVVELDEERAALVGRQLAARRHQPQLLGRLEHQRRRDRRPVAVPRAPADGRRLRRRGARERGDRRRERAQRRRAVGGGDGGARQRHHDRPVGGPRRRAGAHLGAHLGEEEQPVGRPVAGGGDAAEGGALREEAGERAAAAAEAEHAHPVGGEQPRVGGGVGGRRPRAAWKAPEKVGNGVVGCGWAPWSTPANEKLCQPLRRKADSRAGAARHART